MFIAPAKPHDACLLSELARESKASWGYPERWLAAWQPLLTVSPAYLSRHPAFVAAAQGRPLGFAVVELLGQTASLEHLWVRLGSQRSGIGRALFERCEEAARRAGATNIQIESDPNAEPFYLRMGATRVGRVSADMDGVKRFLPLLRKRL